MANLFRPELATYLFIFITLLWWLEFLLFKKKASGKGKGTHGNRSSFYLILAAIVLPLIVSTIFYFVDIGNLGSATALVIRYSGIAVYAAGIFIRYWSLILLGIHFSRDVDVKADQPLISSGPYRVIRHPSYTGLLLLNVGLHFFIGNLPGTIIALVSITIALHIRILEEEQSMEATIGERYYDWKIGRKRLFPWVY